MVTSIDCTLRDGGYYKSLEFGPELVAAYIEAIVLSCVDVVEIGLRSLDKKYFMGGF